MILRRLQNALTKMPSINYRGVVGMGAAVGAAGSSTRRRSPETRPERRRKNTESLPAHERPPHERDFLVFFLELELDLLNDYTGVEWLLCPRAPTCRATLERAHSPLATPRSALARALRLCPNAIAAAMLRARRSPLPLNLAKAQAATRTHALTHTHTHTYTWTRTHAPRLPPA